MDPYQFNGGTAVVTGAASGIGEALAVQLAARGSALVLVDRDEERLAGVALGGRFDQVTLEEFDWVMAVNFRSVVRLTHAFLPVLKAHPGSHLVNVSSVFGIFAPAGQAAYAASKFAVRGFSESVRHELAEDRVGVTVVHPGGIRTRIAESARTGSGVSIEEYERGRTQFARLLRMDPAVAAARIMAAIENRRPRLLIGWSAKVPDVLVRLMPGSYWKLIARRAGRPAAR